MFRIKAVPSCMYTTAEVIFANSPTAPAVLLHVLMSRSSHFLCTDTDTWLLVSEIGSGDTPHLAQYVPPVKVCDDITEFTGSMKSSNTAAAGRWHTAVVFVLVPVQQNTE